MIKYYWLAVTADEYELPMVVEDNPHLLAEKLGIDYSTVYSRFKRGNDGSRTGMRIIKVERLSDEETL